MIRGRQVTPGDLSTGVHRVVGCNVSVATEESCYALLGVRVVAAESDPRNTFGLQIKLFLGPRGSIQAVATTDNRWQLLPRDVVVPHLTID